MQQLTVAEGVICHEESGEAFLLHVPSGRYYGLNATGLEVWEALVAGSDPVEALHRRWPDAPYEVCRTDTERILESLIEAGLVRSASDTDPR
jgi:Coenzyme PQQ synthesis protein D (PqqD)